MTMLPSMAKRGRPSKRSIAESEFNPAVAAHAAESVQSPIPGAESPRPLKIRDKMDEEDMAQAKIREAVHRANMAAIDEQAARVRYEVERGGLITKSEAKDMLQAAIVAWIGAIEQVPGRVRGRMLDDPKTIQLADGIESCVTEEIDRIRSDVYKATR